MRRVLGELESVVDVKRVVVAWEVYVAMELHVEEDLDVTEQKLVEECQEMIGNGLQGTLTFIWRN